MEINSQQFGYNPVNTSGGTVNPPVSAYTQMTDQQKRDAAETEWNRTHPTVSPYATTPTPGANPRYSNPYSNLPQSVSETDVNSIYEQERQRVQGLIDATNRSFNDQVSQANEQGEGLVAQTTAMAARAGLIGSARGQAQEEQQKTLNRRVVQQIEYQRQLAVQEIYGKVDDRAREEVKLRKAEALENRDFLQTSQTEAKKDWQDIAKSGTTFKELDPTVVSNFLTQTGYDEFTAKAIYNANLPKGLKTDYQYKIEGNKLFAYGVDPVTQELTMLTKDLGIGAVPGGYSEKVMADGTLALIPDKIDTTKSLDSQILIYGKSGDFKSETDTKPTEAEKLREYTSTMAGQLNEVVGDKTYLTPANYIFYKRRWGVKGLSSKLFDETFANYRDPSVNSTEYGITLY